MSNKEQSRTSASEEAMTSIYGLLYRFSDHKRGERIRYRIAGEGERSGVIVWVQPPGETARKHLPVGVRYIVSPDQDTGMPDFVAPGDIILTL